MKIAIPTAGKHVDEHFGHARTFTIFTLDNDKASSRRRPSSRLRAAAASPPWA
jgi:predicted Fe-Mo cluster-binding NifX family protein